MKSAYLPFDSSETRPDTNNATWNWHQVLIEEAQKVPDMPSLELSCEQFAPMKVFNEPPMKTHMAQLKKGFLIEVMLPHSDPIYPDMIKVSNIPVWFAEVIHVAGYFIIARWSGAVESDGVFWIHAANVAVNRVGGLEKKPSGKYVFIPPNSIFDYHTPQGWLDYSTEHVLGQYTPYRSFDHRRNNIFNNKFRVNERVETTHDENSSVLVPAIITKILGRRVLLEYSKDDIDKANQMKKENMWKDMDDDLIYPVGFAESMGLRMTANKKYRTHVAAIAKAINNGENVPYMEMDAKRETVFQWRENQTASAEWEVDMVCEMLDRLDECQNALKAARVLKVLPEGYLQLGPDGPDIETESLYLHQTSPLLFPVGYAKTYNIALDGPKGAKEKNFEWKSYLKRTNYKAAPENVFHNETEEDVPFKVGMRMEAIDQSEKLLCPVTVKAIKGRLVLVGFDGWGDEYDTLYDFQSNELLPCGWGEMVGYTLQRPRTDEP